MKLDTWTPTSKVFSEHEPRETTLYLIQENGYERDMLTMTYKEIGFVKDYKQSMIYTQHEAATREGQNAKTFKGNLMIRNTYREDVLAVTFEEKDVMLMIDIAYKEDMLTMSPQEDVNAENHMMGNKDLIEDGQDTIKKTNLVYKRGTKGDAKRLAVSAIASKGGRRGHN